MYRRLTSLLNEFLLVEICQVDVFTLKLFEIAMEVDYTRFEIFD